MVYFTIFVLLLFYFLTPYSSSLLLSFFLFLLKIVASEKLKAYRKDVLARSGKVRMQYLIIITYSFFLFSSLLFF
jgi:hypothetical protein